MVWVWIWKIYPKMSNFSVFFASDKKKSLRVGSESTRVKGMLASFRLRIKSKLGSGWVRAQLYSRYSFPTNILLNLENPEFQFFSKWGSESGSQIQPYRVRWAKVKTIAYSQYFYLNLWNPQPWLQFLFQENEFKKLFLGKPKNTVPL